MNLMEKNMELSSLMNSFKEVLKSYDNKGFSVYVETNYFRDSYDVSNVPASVYLVPNGNGLVDETIGMLLNSVTCYFLINVVSLEEFIGNYKDNTTLIGETD